jgi:chromate transporter
MIIIKINQQCRAPPHTGFLLSDMQILLKANTMNSTRPHTQNESQSAWHIFLIFLRLGLTSFGGPVAHLVFFRDEFVSKRKWLSEESYADVASLCQFLPGPASSQVGMALGYCKGGYKGVVAAWCGFTLPSAFALILLALTIQTQSQLISPELIHGLKLVAVAVVAQAVWGMAKSLCPDRIRITIMMLSTCAVLLTPAFLWAQIIVIAAACYLFQSVQCDPARPPPHSHEALCGCHLDEYVLCPAGSPTTPQCNLPQSNLVFN